MSLDSTGIKKCVVCGGENIFKCKCTSYMCAYALMTSWEVARSSSFFRAFPKDIRDVLTKFVECHFDVDSMPYSFVSRTETSMFDYRQKLTERCCIQRFYNIQECEIRRYCYMSERRTCVNMEARLASLKRRDRDNRRMERKKTLPKNINRSRRY